jgi:hypothetical protein
LFPPRSGLTKEDIFSGYSDPVELALDDLVDEKYLLSKSFRAEGSLPGQISICSKCQKKAEEEREKITQPIPGSSSAVSWFSHSPFLGLRLRLRGPFGLRSEGYVKFLKLTT